MNPVIYLIPQKNVSSRVLIIFFCENLYTYIYIYIYLCIHMNIWIGFLLSATKVNIFYNKEIIYSLIAPPVACKAALAGHSSQKMQVLYVSIVRLPCRCCLQLYIYFCILLTSNSCYMLLPRSAVMTLSIELMHFSPNKILKIPTSDYNCKLWISHYFIQIEQ